MTKLEERRQEDESFAKKYNITEDNLARRREFLHLGEKDKEILVDLIPWAKEIAPSLIEDFYDWQFSFPSTKKFLEKFAEKKGLTLQTLREHLEKSQREYFITVFTGARESWGVAYFNERLKVGWIHDQINLPFKWYIGAYNEYQRLVRRYLRDSFDDREKIESAEEAIFKVFNYDMQAVGDSFMLNTLESLGINLSGISSEEGLDKTELLDEIKELRNLKLILEQITEHSSSLASSSEQLSAVSQELSTSAEESHNQTNSVSSSVNQINDNLQMLATGAEEMSTSIQEISRHSSQAANVAQEAVGLSQETKETMVNLEKSSSEVDEVIRFISDIAIQTKLLALNATIEAARAGEGGKGFSVVASEIKELAKETSHSTDSIRKKIQSMQDQSRDSLRAIEEITGIVDKISDLQTTIASSIEEQTATTNEITRNIIESSDFVSDISKNMEHLSETSQNTAEGAHNTMQAAQDMARIASEMEKTISQFQGGRKD